MTEQAIRDFLAYANTHRVRVELTFNEDYGLTNTGDPRRMRCYIGRSTGRQPVYLIIKRRDSSGGEAVSPDELASVRVIAGRR